MTDPARATSAIGDDALSARDRDLLRFEEHWRGHSGTKEQAIRESFGMPAARYYQVLSSLLDSPAASAAEPLLIGRLRRMRDDARSARRRRYDAADPRGV
jgi:Protein of unknown function (DUF3263)